MATLVAGCGGVVDVPTPADTEVREPCAEHNQLRHAYYGDLHVHTTYSFDAHIWDTRTTPAQAYQFARGEPVALPPLDANGRGTRTVRLQRPLEFAAVTDHSEYLGEVDLCATPESPGYDSVTCQLFRAGGVAIYRRFGALLSHPHRRFEDVCGPDDEACAGRASEVWRRIQEAAESAYDRSAACSFTTFVAYEHTATPGGANRHRNVIFRTERVPLPTSYFEQPTAQGLWTQLRATCLDAGIGCDVLSIPHNSNESNGNAFFVEYPGAASREEERAQAEFRASMEPLVEIFQHKGDSECMNGLSGATGAPDELCGFEKRRTPPLEDCGDGKGLYGAAGGGCVSRLDYVRTALLVGLQERERLGVNPYQLGFIGSTDTHNGTPGATEESTFAGHAGTEDSTPATLMERGTSNFGSLTTNPGGVAAVWAEENSRSSIFDALRRRETFATSGPRIAVRFFGGWNVPESLCRDPDMVKIGYAQSVPMGGILGASPAEGTAPAFLVSALRDAGTASRPGTQLQRIQIIKGWLEGGAAHHEVFDVAGDKNNGAGVDISTCGTFGSGADALCTVWSDPAFRPQQHAFYYARVLENPTCRWNTHICNALPPEEQPPACADPGVPKTIQERAWTSPIWYSPPNSQ